MDRAGVSPGTLDAEAISFTLAPRINAAGRVDHAITSYRLLTATSTAEAQPLAEELNSRNRQRRSHTEEAFTRVQSQLGDSVDDDPIIIAGGPGFEPGWWGWWPASWPRSTTNQLSSSPRAPRSHGPLAGPSPRVRYHRCSTAMRGPVCPTRRPLPGRGLRYSQREPGSSQVSVDGHRCREAGGARPSTFDQD